MAKFERTFTKKLKTLFNSEASTKVVLTMLRDTRVPPLVALNQTYKYAYSMFHGAQDLSPEDYLIFASFQGVMYTNPTSSYNVTAFSTSGNLFNLPHLRIIQTSGDTMEGFNRTGVMYLDRTDLSDPSIVYVVPENKYYIKAPTLFFP